MKVAFVFASAIACASAFINNGVALKTSALTRNVDTTRMMGEVSEQSRRDFLKVAGTAAVASTLISTVGGAPAYAEGPYTLPDLPYAYDALEPYIDAATMKFHHDKHHATYVANVNKAMAGKDAPSILALQKDALKTGGAIRNSGGGHYNHCFFWKCMGPASQSGAPSAAVSYHFTFAKISSTVSPV
mmetsp:Transcript_17612/g.22195  ORF Transcript_17612/g.22195 Transcript_17612/m.22195 type:complete len:187 (+) Transcript_17612:86-646(+)